MSSIGSLLDLAAYEMLTIGAVLFDTQAALANQGYLLTNLNRDVEARVASRTGSINEPQRP